MLPKPIDQIDVSDLDNLIANEISEKRTLDYKKVLPGKSDKDKLELRADATSFANSSGGIIFFGIEEDGDGKPIRLHGITDEGQDEAILRIEQTLSTRIDPPLPSIQSHAIPTSSGPIVAVQIGKSWRAPHLIELNGSFRMYSRSSRGKQPLDGREVRLAFEGSRDLLERISRWHDDRISKILANDTPIALANAPRYAIHIIPLDSFRLVDQIPAKSLAQSWSKFQPLISGSEKSHVNLDGHLAYGGNSYLAGTSNYLEYCQVFRSGRIESVTTEWDQDGLLRFGGYEKRIIEGISQYLTTLESHGISYPIAIMASMHNVKGCKMAADDRVYRRDIQPIDRDLAILPDVLIEHKTNDLSGILKPIFDAAWNACGIHNSPNYDNDGSWAGPPLSGT